jgi:hypothetical protein
MPRSRIGVRVAQPDRWAPRNNAIPSENFMKLMLATVLLLSLSSCVVAPTDTGKGGGDTVVVCHKGKKTLELPRSAAKAHLDHGDRVGRC